MKFAMPHRLEPLFTQSHALFAAIIAAAIPIADASSVAPIWVVAAFYVLGGCLGAICQVAFFPSRSPRGAWDGVKFVANWAASLVFAPGIMFMAKLPEDPRVILLVSGACAIGAVYLVRFTRDKVAKQTKEDE